MNLTDFMNRDVLRSLRKKIEAFQNGARYLTTACGWNLEESGLMCGLSQSAINSRLSPGIVSKTELEISVFLELLGLMHIAYLRGDAPIFVPITLFRLVDDKFCAPVSDEPVDLQAEGGMEKFFSSASDVWLKLFMKEGVERKTSGKERFSDLYHEGYLYTFLLEKKLHYSAKHFQLRLVQKVAPRLVEMFVYFVEWQQDKENDEKKSLYESCTIGVAKEETPLKYDDSGFCKTELSDDILLRAEKASLCYIPYLISSLLDNLINATKTSSPFFNLLDMFDVSREKGMLPKIRRSFDEEGTIPPCYLVESPEVCNRYGLKDSMKEFLLSEYDTLSSNSST